MSNLLNILKSFVTIHQVSLFSTESDILQTGLELVRRIQMVAAPEAIGLEFHLRRSPRRESLGTRRPSLFLEATVYRHWMQVQFGHTG